jgi:glutathione peroxidase
MSLLHCSLGLAVFVIPVLGFAAAGGGADAPPAAVSPSSPTSPMPENALDFTVKDIDGKDVNLAGFRGKTLLIVNVASFCGNTPQYEALEKLYTKYKDRGFVVLGFPANNFKNQEPNSNADIKEFCTSKYHVDFPMFAKISAKGDDIAPLFKYLTAQDCQPLSKGDIAWNFEKFLVNRNGKLVGRFANKMQPDDPTVVGAIEAALK